jgi:hypothetical protein
MAASDKQITMKLQRHLTKVLFFALLLPLAVQANHPPSQRPGGFIASNFYPDN